MKKDKGKAKMLPGWRIMQGDTIRPMTRDEIREVLLHGEIVKVEPFKKPSAGPARPRGQGQ